MPVLHSLKTLRLQKKRYLRWFLAQITRVGGRLSARRLILQKRIAPGAAHSNAGRAGKLKTSLVASGSWLLQNYRRA